MFLIAGGQKCATSTLTSLLDRVQEIKFLKDSTIFEGPRNPERIMKAFSAIGFDISNSRSYKNIGIGRPNILTNMKSHLYLKDEFPDAKLIIVLRNPIDRTISAYFHYMRDGAIPVEDIDVGLMRILRNMEDAARAREVVGLSKYGSGLASLVERFGYDQIHLIDYARLISSPFEVVDDVLSFIGVSISDSQKGKIQDQKVPLLQKTPNDISDVLIERMFRRSPRPEDGDPLSEVEEYYRRDRSTTLNGKGLPLRTFAALWAELSDDTEKVARLYPEWAPVVKRWYQESLRSLDQKRDFSLNVVRRHPRKKSTLFGKKQEYCISAVAGKDPWNIRPVGPLFVASDTKAKGSLFVADPFFIDKDGINYVFYESRIQSRAIIEVAKIEDDGTWAPLGTAIQEDFHLSYPHVFTYGEGIFMMLEGVAGRSLSLYQCTNFPLGWVKRRDLAAGQFADPTPFEWKQQLYIFTGRARQLEIYLLDLERDEITPHPLNPIDVPFIYHRMGGGIIEHDGRLFRPSQRNQPTYGYNLDLHEIIELSPTTYRERPHSVPFLPRPGVLDQEEWSQMIHHIHLKKTGDGYFGVIDGRDQPGRFTF
ncbi:sulfotransferase [Limnoraphis robusta CCNP1324]|uniref:sulfotransferase family protein n=1 Tax=Limnoraphis robusta TaxID=1118279 RepID=UPI002B215B8C|nr:sulfotransferase [Limnoraphis robusta]MEA5547637.1 sulfotransferase [Limnoraphis robusta CCNP1324]